ncbi:MAG: outer membrane beta-barrel domain-containing protein [Deltaproteobacteria bacterium]|nr:outer membrane beta-barrel domain-containing protein [Deltaproteobacteria bacterium]
MRRLFILSTISAVAFGFVPASSVSADEGDEASHGYAAMAVQNRLYTQTGELTAFVGVLPMDAFTKGLTLSAAYTHHFSDHWAWEVVHFFYSFHIETDLRDDLEAFDLGPIPFEVIEHQMVTSNAVFKPVYWKGSVYNDSLIYGELMVLAGAGYAWFTRSERMAVDLGIAMRVYVSGLLSFRVDVRHHIFFDDEIFKQANLDHELWIGLGTSISF